MTPSLMPFLMKEISIHLQSVQRFAVVSLVDVELRLGNLILAYVEAAGHQQGTSVELPFKRTQPELAAAIGTGERSINRMMCKWKKDRVLEKIFGRYVIYDQNAIQRLGK
ncbi:MAG: Crp/Fnr family transcriptional regulator [Deltaproteobacteria bacterium]|nr:Crp/Fnr family transcriptional regulator [Deltaproteobacteria bacterium]